MITKSLSLSKAVELGNVCRQRNRCCQFGSGALAEGDLKNIASFLKITEDKLKEKYLEEVTRFNTKRLRPKIKRKKGLPYGPCIFFANGCKIHKVKPLECRVATCDENGEALSIWFMLNYFVNPTDPKSIREYAYYLKTRPTIPGGKLEELVPDRKQLKKMMEKAT